MSKNQRVVRRTRMRSREKWAKSKSSTSNTDEFTSSSILSHEKWQHFNNFNFCPFEYLIFRRWRWSQFPMITIILWNQRDGARAIFESGVHERRRVIVVHQWLDVFLFFNLPLGLDPPWVRASLPATELLGVRGWGGWQAARAAVCRRGRQGQAGRQPSGPLPPGKGHIYF